MYKWRHWPAPVLVTSVGYSLDILLRTPFCDSPVFAESVFAESPPPPPPPRRGRLGPRVDWVDNGQSCPHMLLCWSSRVPAHTEAVWGCRGPWIFEKWARVGSGQLVKLYLSTVLSWNSSNPYLWCIQDLELKCQFMAIKIGPFNHL